MKEIKLDGWTFKPSTEKHKKYDAYKNDTKIASFGDKRYEHYKDRIGLYNNLDHNDKERRKNYRARHSSIKLKDGRQAYKVKGTPAYFSYKYLW